MRHCRDETLRTGGVRTGEIEGAKQTGKILALDKAIDRAPGAERLGRNVLRAPARRQIDSSGNAQQRVAQPFKVEPAPVHFPKQLIARVRLGQGRLVFAALLIGAGKHHQPMQPLERPPVLHQARGEIIQQLRMAWRVGAYSEVAGRAHEGSDKVVHPDAIGDDAGGQRVIRADNGSGQFQTSAPLGERPAARAFDQLQKLARNFGPGVVRIAPDEDPGIMRRGIVDQDHRPGRRARMGGVQLIHFPLQRAQVLAHRSREETGNLSAAQTRDR